MTTAEHSSMEHHAGGMMHVASARSLLATFGALIVLTFVTVIVPRLGLTSGTVDLVIAMVIATIKATLVALFFMHLRHERSFNVVVFLSAFAFVAVFISFTMVDSFQYQPTLEWTEKIVPPEPGAVAPAGH